MLCGCTRQRKLKSQLRVLCFWVDGWAELSFVVAVGMYLLGAMSFRQALMLPSLSVPPSFLRRTPWSRRCRMHSIRAAASLPAVGSLDVGSNDFWAGIDVACILHYSWEGLPFAPAMDDAHIGVAVGTCVYSVAAMSFRQALMLPSLSVPPSFLRRTPWSRRCRMHSIRAAASRGVVGCWQQ